MNKSILISIVIGIVVVGAISASLILASEDSSESEVQPVYDTGFTYYDIEPIQDTLAEQGIFVSTPTAITDHTISEYCTYFEKGLPRTVEYCTTTAVLDLGGRTMGNINIGGDTNSPIMAVTNLETATLESNQDEVFAVFNAVIEILVCDCWEAEQSKDYESISAWLEAVQTFYYDSDKRNIKSKIDNLGGSQILLEITSKDDSLLQTLIILKK